MDLRFACADFTFPLFSHEKALKLIRLLDIEAVDIGFFHNRSHIQPSDVFSNISSKSAELKRDLDRNGLKPADLFLQLAEDFHSQAINHPEEGVRTEVREAFLKTLEVAKNIGAGHVSILPGAAFPNETNMEAEKRAVDELAWRIEKADAADLEFGIEAHIGSFCETPDGVASLLKAVKGLTLTLDYTHFTKQGFSDSEIEMLIPFASHFHARGARKERAQSSLQENTIDYERVVKTMIQNDYSGYLGLEYVWIAWEHMNEVDNLSETIQLKQLIETAYNKIVKEKE